MQSVHFASWASCYSMLVSFHYLFISALMKGKRLQLPSENESNQPTVSCRCLTSWNIKSNIENVGNVSVFGRCSVLTCRDVISRICIPFSRFPQSYKKQGAPQAKTRRWRPLITDVFLFFLWFSACLTVGTKTERCTKWSRVWNYTLVTWKGL